MPASKKTTTKDRGPCSAAHMPPSPPPGQPAAPPADGPAAAIWAALTASPGATAAGIAGAAHTSRAIAGRELAALEAAGLATRIPGTRNGRATAPATWHPVPAAAPPGPATACSETPSAAAAGILDPAGGVSLPAPSDGTAGEPGDSPAGAAAADDTARGETAQAHADDNTPGVAAIARGAGTDPAPGGQGRPAPADGAAGDPGSSPAGAGAADGTGPDETAKVPAGDEVPGGDASDTAAGAGPDDVTPDAPAAGEDRGGEPGPGEEPCQLAATAEAAVQLRELAAAVTQAMAALDGGDTAAALAAMDTVHAAAAQGRRLVKAAASGRKPRGTGPGARPGQLRELVAAHLAAHPDTDFTPHQIGRVLARSSGAVANALDKLTALGQAQMTCEKPRRYRAAAIAPALAGTI